MVKLVIKAPNQKIDDCEVLAEMGWTVRQLKQHLSANYPSRPATSDQRLIYSGHLMRDDQTLQQVFSSSSANEESGTGTVTLHLVCSNSATSSHHSSTTSSPTSSPAPATVPAAPRPHNPVNNSQQGIDRTGLLPAAAGSNLVNAAAFPAMIPQVPLAWTPEQLALAHQMYQQFMSQLQANPHSLPSLLVPSLSHISNMSTASAATTTTPTTTPQIPIRNPGGQVPGGAGAAAPPPLVIDNNNIQLQNNNNGQPMPGGGAAAGAPIRQDDDDDEDPDMRDERDFLGWFYWLSRAVVLFSVVYFYSSMARFVVVVLFAILMYIYQAGVFVPRHIGDEMMEEVDPVEVNGDEPAGAPVAGDQVPEQVPPAGMDQQVPPVAGGAGAAVQRRGSNDTTVTERNGLRMVWLVLSSLFTSLIPEQPPAHFN